MKYLVKTQDEGVSLLVAPFLGDNQTNYANTPVEKSDVNREGTLLTAHVTYDEITITTSILPEDVTTVQELARLIHSLDFVLEKSGEIKNALR